MTRFLIISGLSTGLNFGFMALLTGCDTLRKNPIASEVSSEPSSGIETIAIMGTNDIHGALAPEISRTVEPEGVEPVEYEIGGVSMIAAYAKALQSEFGERFLWLDAGDEYQGSVESNLSLGSTMVQFFNRFNLHAAAVGNHEFDFGQDVLKARMQEAKFPYLSANILDSTTGKRAEFPNTFPRRIFKMGNLKVGVLGLSTLDTPTSTLARHVSNLKFENLKEAALRESEELRRLGANIVLIVAHAGLKCLPGKLPSTALVRKPLDHQGGCGDHDEMVRLLRSLPAGTVDAVVSGHSHTVVHHWVAGVPVIQGGCFGRYLNVIYLSYDWGQKALLTDESKIEGPISVCSRVFENQNDCIGDRPAPKQGRGTLISPQFHGKTISPDADAEKWLRPILKEYGTVKNKVLGIAVRGLTYSRSGESPMGDFMADSIRKAVQADFGYANPGGVRHALGFGPITYGDVFRSFPFDNEIALLKVTAQELRWIMQVAQNGSRGFGSVSGLRLRLIDLSLPAPYDDLNHDGVENFWEANRLLEITHLDGSQLDSKKMYTLALSDFLVTGGDGLEWPMAQIPAERITLSTGIKVRDALSQNLQSMGTVNSEEAPIMNVNQPRIILESDRSKIASYRRAFKASLISQRKQARKKVRARMRPAAKQVSGKKTAQKSVQKIDKPQSQKPAS